MDIVKKYATVLFEEASDLKLVDKAFTDIETLQQVIFTNKEIPDFFESPANIEDKYSLISKISSNYDLSPIAKRFVMQVVRLKRIRLLPKMVACYKSLMNNNRRYAEVTTARAASSSDVKEIEKIIAKKFGDNFDVEYKSDEAIIGGIVIKVEDLLLDLSVRTALEKLI